MGNMIRYDNFSVIPSVLLYYFFNQEKLKKKADLRYPWWLNGKESACQCMR